MELSVYLCTNVYTHTDLKTIFQHQLTIVRDEIASSFQSILTLTHMTTTSAWYKITFTTD